MTALFWVLGNSFSISNTQHLCSFNFKSNLAPCPKLPCYMQPKQEVPIIYSFKTEQIANRFILNRVYEKHIHQNNIQRDERPFITFAKNFPAESSYEPNPLMYPLQLSTEDEFLSKLVVSSFSQFFVIDTFTENKNLITVEGYILDPINELTKENTQSVQRMMFKMLEETYLKS
jgi:hypothetical protein